jgi:hypothetical protein
MTLKILQKVTEDKELYAKCILQQIFHKKTELRYLNALLYLYKKIIYKFLDNFVISRNNFGSLSKTFETSESMMASKFLWKKLKNMNDLIFRNNEKFWKLGF